MEEVTLLGGKVRFIPVKLKAEWMGNAPGTILSLNHVTAQSLLSRKSAVLVNKKKDKGATTKDIPEPPKNKMVSGPVRKKRI